MKKDLEKKKKIKDLIFKIVHSICYVLSALFIIVCVSVGVQSCNSKTNKQKVNNNSLRLDSNRFADGNYLYPYIYKSNYGPETIHYDISWARTFNGQYDVPNGGYSSAEADILYQFNLPNLDSIIYYKSDETFHNVYAIQYRFKCFRFNASLYLYRLYNVMFLSSNQNFEYMHKVNDDAGGYDYNVNNDITILSSSNLISDYGFNLWFSIYSDTRSLFYWSTILRVNFPVAPSVTSIMIQDNRFNNEYLYQVSYDTPYFVSNGELFNQIRFTYVTGYYNTTQNEVRICYGTNQQTSPGWVDRTALKNGQAVFTTMSYYNSDTEKLTPVYYREAIDANEGETSDHPYIYKVYTDKCLWVLNSYQALTFLQQPNESLMNNLDSVNNGQSTINPNGNSGYSILNVFTLISYAFTSLIPLLNIQLIPGMVIGTFFFIPLLVAIISILVRLVKK